MKKVGIYVVSVMAFNQLHPNAPQGGTYTEHLPALIPAASIKDAAEAAKAFAFEKWPISDMWYGHQACIEPVTKFFFDAAATALAAEAVDFNDSEPPEYFQFESG